MIIFMWINIISKSNFPHQYLGNFLLKKVQLLNEIFIKYSAFC